MNSFPSFKIVPVPKGALEVKDMEDRVKRLSAMSCKERPKHGTLPDSLWSLGGAITFNYAFETELSIRSFDGTKIVDSYDEVPVVFFEKLSMVAIGFRPKDVEGRVLSFIQDNFVRGYALEPIRFEESDLRSIIE